MQDDPILAELRSLPREKPRAGFAERVLARLDEAPRRPFPFSRGPFVPPRPAWVAAVLALGLAGGWSLHRVEAAKARREQLAALRAEGDRLAAELAALRATVEPAAGKLIYLGGDEANDYVIDLARLALSRLAPSRQEELRAHPNLQPASLRDRR